LGVDQLISVRSADLSEPLPFASQSFDVAMSLDVVLHVSDRTTLYREVARVLSRGGRFLVTDAGVVTGPISNEEVHLRAKYGYTQFVPVGWNEGLLAAAGFRSIHTENRTHCVLRNATGRLAAMESHRGALERAWGGAELRSQMSYLEAVIELGRRGALSRMAYLAEV
jgi:SAM-dependent methyltransferase